MASLYKKPVIKLDAATSEKIHTKSRKWWGQYRDADGRLRRCPLAADKKAAEKMLNDLVRQVEREKAGLVDPTDAQRKRPLKQHLNDFKRHLQNKGVTPKQLQTVTSQIDKLAAAAKWRLIGDITAGSAMDFLSELKRQGRSAQTCNHYLKSAKSFTAWLVRDQRTPTDPLRHLSRQNVAADRRHDRRALSTDEFSRLLAAARQGPRIEGTSGPDRAMMYTLAAWTGFRKGEIGSLTRRSLDLDGDPPTATVEACYSKRRRRDTQILHSELVSQLRSWLATKRRLKPDEPLFPVSGRVPGGTDRKTHKMMRLDLEAARQKWIEEAKSQRERNAREESDFLAYCNHVGLVVDFHALRHLFITSLERAGISPRMAQSLARHNDIRLTLQTYTHIELHDQRAAIQSLPGPQQITDQRNGERPCLRRNVAS
jgi:integrase